jgi:hypothetical protein
LCCAAWELSFTVSFRYYLLINIKSSKGKAV